MSIQTQLHLCTRTVAGGLLLVVLVGRVGAAPPALPLPPPSFSFDRNSPTVLGGFVGAADILAYGLPHPLVEVPAFALGLTNADDLDGVSAGLRDGMPAGPFALLFSVGRLTLGTVPPEHTLVLAGVPFNAFDQAQRGHQAGDQYMSLELFSAAGQGGTRVANNTLVRNNFDEGGTSFTAEPSLPAYGQNSPRGPQDNVDASAVLDRSPPRNGQIANVYFSLASDSPSLSILTPDFPSGANIFFRALPGSGSTTPYARGFELGLQLDDDIDALRVFDCNGNAVFDYADRVLFSLSPGSPSLGGVPGATGATVFLAIWSSPPTFSTFSTGATLGVGAAPDNVDALDLVSCNDSIACGTVYGIRLRRGDLNCDGQVDFDDINPFVLALADPDVYAAAFPDCDIMHGDFNADGSVDFDDINPFVGALTTPLGACCSNGLCYGEVSPAECAALGGLWQGPGTLCNPSPCAPVGDTCADARLVSEPLPYTDLGNTCAFNDDYDEACPFAGSVAPDVVYQYTPSSDVIVTISLCFDETNYDTKLYVYEGGCPGVLIACNDDYCSTASYPPPYVSEVQELALFAGLTYYVIVDGYGSSCGVYHLEIRPCAACPPCASREQEPCGTDTNGGCNMPTPTFEVLPYTPITVCGSAWFDGAIRDTDWYELNLAVPAIVTVTGVGEVNNMVFGWIEQYTPGVPGCGNITGYLNPYFVAAECVAGIYTTACTPAGTYYLFAATDFSTPAPCPVAYMMTVSWEPCTPAFAACCVGSTCIGDLEAPACAAAGGVWYEGQTCATFVCPGAPPNDLCTSATEVGPPYPLTVSGTTIGATLDCPGVLDWNAVWYRVFLPYPNNRLAIRYCGTSAGIGTVGIVYYAACDDCQNYVITSGYAWNNCSFGGSYGIDMWWDNVVGPGWAYVPAYLVDSGGLPMDFVATLNVTPLDRATAATTRSLMQNCTTATASKAPSAPKLSR